MLAVQALTRFDLRVQALTQMQVGDGDDVAGPGRGVGAGQGATEEGTRGVVGGGQAFTPDEAGEVGGEEEGWGGGHGNCALACDNARGLRPPAQRGYDMPTEPTSRPARQRLMRRPLTQDLSAPPPRTYSVFAEPASLEQVGWAGVPRGRAGIASQERNPELRPYLARGYRDDPGVYDEMLRTDGTVAGTLAMVAREISRARWAVEAPERPTAKEREAAEMVERYLSLGSSPFGQARAKLSRAVLQAPSARMWSRVMVLGVMCFLVWLCASLGADGVGAAGRDAKLGGEVGV